MTAIATPTRPTLIHWIEILALGVIWGASFLCVSIALDGFSPLWVATGRIVLAALALGALCLALRLPLPGPRLQPGVWRHAIGMGFFTNALPFTLIAWAQQQVPSSFVGISMALVPLFTLALAHVALPGERMTLPRLAGVALGLVGVVVLIGPASLAEGDLVARLTCIIVTLSYATGAIITRRSPPVDPIAFSTAALLAALVMILPLTLALEGLPASDVPLRAWAALAYLGLMPTAFATLLMVHVIRSAGPNFLTLTNYQVPVWSMIFGALILNEALAPSFLAALALILTGLALSRRAA